MGPCGEGPCASWRIPVEDFYKLIVNSNKNMNKDNCKNDENRKYSTVGKSIVEGKSSMGVKTKLNPTTTSTLKRGNSGSNETVEDDKFALYKNKNHKTSNKNAKTKTLSVTRKTKSTRIWNEGIGKWHEVNDEKNNEKQEKEELTTDDGEDSSLDETNEESEKQEEKEKQPRQNRTGDQPECKKCRKQPCVCCSKCGKHKCICENCPYCGNELSPVRLCQCARKRMISKSTSNMFGKYSNKNKHLSKQQQQDLQENLEDEDGPIHHTFHFDWFSEGITFKYKYMKESFCKKQVQFKVGSIPIVIYEDIIKCNYLTSVKNNISNLNFWSSVTSLKSYTDYQYYLLRLPQEVSFERTENLRINLDAFYWFHFHSDMPTRYVRTQAYYSDLRQQEEIKSLWKGPDQGEYDRWYLYYLALITIILLIGIADTTIVSALVYAIIGIFTVTGLIFLGRSTYRLKIPSLLGHVALGLLPGYLIHRLIGCIIVFTSTFTQPLILTIIIVVILERNKWIYASRQVGNVPYAVLWFAPVFSAHVEEFLKSIPGLRWFFVYGIMFCEFLVYRKWNRWHINSMKFNWEDRLIVHLRHNKTCFGTQVALMENIKEEYENRVLQGENMDYTPNWNSVIANPITTTLRIPKDSKIPIIGHDKLISSYLAYPKNDWTETQQANFYFDMKTRGMKSRPVFMVLFPASDMAYAANTLEMARAAIVHRYLLPGNSEFYKPSNVLHIEDQIEPPTRKNFMARGLNILEGIHEAVAAMPLLVDSGLTEDDWMNGLTPKQYYKAMQGEEELTLYNGFKTSIKLMLKGDEFNWTAEKCYARVIGDVSPGAFRALGPQVHKLAHEMIALFDGSTKFNYKDIEVKYMFAVGKRSCDLNDFYKDLQISGGNSCKAMFLGDDTLMAITLNGMVFIMESDFSKFDRSQNQNLRLFTFTHYLMRNGYEKLAKKIESLLKGTKKFNVKIDKKLVEVMTKEEAATINCQISGQPATCEQNTVINMIVSMVVAWLVKLYAQRTYNKISILWASNTLAQFMSDCYKIFGLSAKVKVGKISEVGFTFLRGAFLPDRFGEFKWTRLPSFLLKFGKTLTDPRATYKKDCNAWKKFLLGQWLGYGDMTFSWFHRRLDTHVRKLTNYNQNSHETVIEQLAPWQVLQSTCYIEDDVYDAFILQRYKASRELLEDFCTFFETITELPVVYTHELLSVLGSADY